MRDVTTESITTATIHQALELLLTTYQSEKEESQRADDTTFIQYWECACQTIYEVAATLNIPLDDPWVDPSWVRSVEYQTMLRITRTGRRQCRIRLKTELDQPQNEQSSPPVQLLVQDGCNQ